MSVFALPNKRLFRPKGMSWQLVGNVAFNRSPTNAVITTSEMPGDAWTIRLEYGVNYDAERHEQRAFFNQFRGPAHIFRCFNIAHPEPRGTMRGEPLTASETAFGTYVLYVQTTPGATLKAGDMVGVTANGFPLLIEAAEDVVATGSGYLGVRMTAPARYTIPAGIPVVWQRPFADFLILQAPTIPYEPKVSPGFSVEAVEFIR